MKKSAYQLGRKFSLWHVRDAPENSSLAKNFLQEKVFFLFITTEPIYRPVVLFNHVLKKILSIKHDRVIK